MSKSMLSVIQSRDMSGKSQAEMDSWYGEILVEANRMHGISIKGISGTEEGDEGEAETVGNWNPYKREWEGGRHRKIINLAEEID